MTNMLIYKISREFASNRGHLQDSMNYIEKIGHIGYSTTPLTDLSKVFNCLLHDLLIAKLQSYGI